MSKFQDDIQNTLDQSHPHSDEYHQAVMEVFDDVTSVYRKEPAYKRWNIAERMLEPDRVLRFRVCWAPTRAPSPCPAPPRTRWMETP